MTRKYSVGTTTDTTYLDARKQAVKGFAVSVTLLDYDETYEVLVPNLNEATVKKEIEALLTKRDKLAMLGDVE